ncbi:MAG: UbiA family prenyltransferase [Oscillatoria princeps RMCB-10]|jgi:4-hydroxybenzoate polyprenyltransferase|nr:UbiA family prenyltransferase [Oscillatoria princeps RMCB-10]
MVNRWWVYQRERFPVFKHGLLIAVFSSSAVSYSALLRGQTKVPNAGSLLVAFLSLFLFFLQLRIADEFKDFEDDAQYRPYRPVPRGLVSLRELGAVGAAGAAIQLAVALWLTPALALLLALAWFYLALMTQEFFVREWLKAHPLIYMCSHMVIVPVINFYATACDWLSAGAQPPAGLSWFLAASFFNGAVIEIGRKIRAPQDEEVGVETYSALWGRRHAVLAWLLALGLTATAAFFAARQINFAPAVTGLIAILLSAGVALAWFFLQHPTTKWANLIETISGLWTLLLYLQLGILPLLLRFLHTR